MGNKVNMEGYRVPSVANKNCYRVTIVGGGSAWGNTR